jgi:general secretion pathway protein D
MERVFQRLLAAAAACAILFAAAVPAFAQEAEAAGDPEETVAFHFAQADVRLVADLVSRLTGRSFIIPDSVSGKVSILTQEPIPKTEVLPVFRSMLESIGYTLSFASDEAPVAIVPLPAASPLAGGVTEVIPLQYVQAAEVKRAIEPLVRGGKEGALEVFAAGNHLVVTDTPESLARVHNVIEQLDRPGSASTIEAVSLEHADPDEAARQLRTLLEGTLSSGDQVQRHMAAVTGGAGALPVGLCVVAAPSAGRVLLSGNPEEIRRAKEILLALDVESPNSVGRLNAIFLKYLSAEEAAKSLNALLARTAENGTARRPIGIEPSKSNNALLVDAAPQDFAFVRSLVERLDTIPQQVLVEVLIAEVTLDDGNDLGVEWFGYDQPEGRGTGGFVRSRAGTSDAMFALATNFTTPEGLSLGVLSGRFEVGGVEFPQIPVYLHAVARDRDYKILSDIPLWAQDNLEASVSVVENIPILTSSVEGSGSDRDYIQNIERMDVGIKLKLTPHVNPDGEIQLDLNPSVESVVGDSVDSSAAAYTPTISKSEVSTTITVPDRSCVVISGLIREEKGKSVSKVPLLGDIPFLGWLFRTTSESTTRKNLLIFVTPRIVTDPAMAEAERKRLERNADQEHALEAFEVSEEEAAAREAARQEKDGGKSSRKSSAAAE